jgi:hypothetical protein
VRYAAAPESHTDASVGHSGVPEHERELAFYAGDAQAYAGDAQAGD